MSKGTDTPDLSRTTGRLLLMMRRLVKEEFSVTIHLGDDGAMDELMAFADRSRNSLLRQMARELEAEVQPSASLTMPSAEESQFTPTRYYRGAPVAANSTHHSPPVTSAPEPAKGGLVYRGRVVR